MSALNTPEFKSQEAHWLDIIASMNTETYGSFNGVGGSDAHFKMYERAIKGHPNIAKEYLDGCEAWAKASPAECQDRIAEVRKLVEEALGAQEERVKERMERIMETYRAATEEV
ncbi:uncharacterized protein LAJ45_03623 [Morchella importuna]|uniref:uncharacterized protein n=1 Tax=Morchella importuna TaxID=1174673 RepID=UPI001E8CA27E|nr:uncharacterized protein LAJ45_03623 [Morchella importuna]KAH8152197.1 hypothetical protein LAJ45_03623 [Morchella importuna]